MIDKTIMANLKQVNVSNDAEKTKERVAALWKELPKPKREEILDISGLSKLTVERACNDGRIQARLAVAIAYALKADPFYITGRSDEQQTFDDALVIQFLNKLGYTGVKAEKVRKPYKKSVDKTTPAPVVKKPAIEKPEANEPVAAEAEKPAGAKTGRPVKILKDKVPDEVSVNDKPNKPDEPQDIEAPSSVASPYRDITHDIKPEDKKRLGAMTEDDCIMLLKSHFIQAKFDADRADRLALIKQMLIN